MEKLYSFILFGCLLRTSNSHHNINEFSCTIQKYILLLCCAVRANSDESFERNEVSMSEMASKV